jgi:hypothetical protein
MIYLRKVGLPNFEMGAWGDVFSRIIWTAIIGKRRWNFTLNLVEVLVTAADLVVMTDFVSEAISTATPWIK